MAGSFFQKILHDVRAEVAHAKQRRPLEELKRMLADAPPVRPFGAALGAGGFGVIAEIKERSPSRGLMRRENVDQAPSAYERSGMVRALSILTNRTHFDMSVERMREIRDRVSKPVLRKDFMLDEYQVYEARAFGADAILLMANVLDHAGLESMFALATGLGLDVLFESHTESEIRTIPSGAGIYGINRRKLDSTKGRYVLSRFMRGLGLRDASIQDSTNDLIRFVPPTAIKVAESGIRPDNIAAVRDAGYDAALIGDAFLSAPEGIVEMLARFERALGISATPAPKPGVQGQTVPS